MFVVENTGTIAWKRILDENGVYIASLDELYLGDWAITYTKNLNRVVDTNFSSPSKAATWLWKNRFTLGEPFNQYPEKEKIGKTPKKVAPIIVEEEPSDDLFWDYKK